jgi:sugar transferase (PEP-CTERM/EpsH1 system associated)
MTHSAAIERPGLRPAPAERAASRLGGRERLPRVLLITHRTPAPPDKGDRIRTYNLLRYLADRARVDVAALSDEPPSADTLDELHRLADRVELVPCAPRLRWIRAGASLALGGSATAGLFRSPELKRRIARLLAAGDYDLIVAVCSSMVQYVDRRRTGRAQVLVDLIDVDSRKWFDYAAESRGWRRAAYALEGQRVQRLEAGLAGTCDRVAVTTPAEAECLRAVDPAANVAAISNGVDFDFFHPHGEAAIAPDSCVFVGALDYKPNVDGMTWFCDAVWPEVRRRRPQATLSIVGRRPVPAIERLQTLPGVSLAADVPDVRPALWAASIVVAPLRIARGVQNKVLEALAAGKPVVASPQAIQGLDVAVGEHLWQAETAGEWLAALEALWSDGDRRRRLSAAGRQYVLDRHHWDRCLAPVGDMLAAAAQGAPARP